MKNNFYLIGCRAIISVIILSSTKKYNLPTTNQIDEFSLPTDYQGIVSFARSIDKKKHKITPCSYELGMISVLFLLDSLFFCYLHSYKN